MSVITIQITTDGAAFEDGEETGRILGKLASEIGDLEYRADRYENENTMRLYDVNGNACGQVDIATEVGD